MTEQDAQTISVEPRHPQVKQPSQLLLAGAVALFLAGTGVGVAVGSTTPPSRTIVPSPSVSPPPQGAPQACLDALDKAETALEHARTGIGYSADLMGISGDGITAAARFDVSGIEDATARMNGVTEKINALTPQMGAAVIEYQTAAAVCRAAA